MGEQAFDIREYYSARYGKILLGDSLDFLSGTKPRSVDLIITSPPFGLVRKKEYGNVPADEYLEWFRPFGKQINRVLKNTGSLVIDIGGSWNKGLPTRHLYHFKLLIMLCEECGFHLAQDFYWWNPAKLPTPAEWVTVRRIRAKDAVNKIWWLSKTPWPKASNRRVLQPYSTSMVELLEHGYKPNKRPSGHNISDRFNIDNGAAIPPNLIALPNTESNSSYLRYCKENDLRAHPARFPVELPEFFIRMLTDEGDKVIDPFAGSCVTGEVAERLKRKWFCVELVEDYLKGAIGRFASKEQDGDQFGAGKPRKSKTKGATHYRIARPGVLWQPNTTDRLSKDGGKSRMTKDQKTLPRKRKPASGETEPSLHPLAAAPSRKT